MASEVHTVMPQDSVNIIVNADGLISTQIPVRLILAVDSVFRHAFHDGAGIDLKLVPSPNGLREPYRWQASEHHHGGIAGEGATPYGAMEALAKALKAKEKIGG